MSIVIDQFETHNNILSEETYRKKVYYGWCGKFLGGNVGAPYEGIKNPTEYVTIDRSKLNNLPNDDADYQIVWFELMKEKGLSISSYDLAVFARDNIWYPFGEYGYSIKNVRMGIYPPESGDFNNDYWHSGMGCPIRSEIWAHLFPLSPRKAAEYAVMDGQMDHREISIWSEAFLSAMESACFTADDLESAIETGLKCVPDDSAISAAIKSVMQWTSEGIETFRIREMILNDYAHPDFTHALQNVAFTILALLRGDGDFWKTMEIALNCGYDTDCTCATAAAVLGILGCEKSIDDATLALLPEDFVLGVDVKVETTNIRQLASDVADFAIANGALDTQNEHPQARIGTKSGAPVRYIDEPVVRPSEWTEVELIDPVFRDGGRMIHAAEMEVRTTTNGYAIRLRDEVSEPKDHYKLQIVNGGLNRDFGVATAMKWHYVGPFFDMGDKQEYPDYHPHGVGMEHIPGITEVFSAGASVDKPYVDESELLHDIVNRNSTLLSDCRTFYNGSDLLNLDSQIKLVGPYCAYAFTYFKLDTREKLWFVIGNNSPFKAYLDGKEIMHDPQCKFWMPYNNEKLIELEPGVHSLMLKVVRVDEHLKLSFALKEFAEVHHHRSHFKVGLTWVY